MVPKFVRSGMDWLKQAVTEPRHQLDSWQTTMRFAYDLGVHGWKALNRDDAPQMAAALAFRSLFALLPVLVVSTVLVRAVQGVDQFEKLGSSVIEAMGLHKVRIPVKEATMETAVPVVKSLEVTPEGDVVTTQGEVVSPAKDDDKGASATQPATRPTTRPSHAAASTASTAAATRPTTAPDAEVKTVGLGDWLEDLIGGAAQLDLAALGWIGLAVVIYSAIGLMVTIENSFNLIYGAPQGRSWARRVPVYWLVLTLSPVFIGIALYLDKQFDDHIRQVHLAWGWVLTAAKYIWGYTLAWLFMFGVYRLVPNTKVTIKAALAGGFVAAGFLSLGKGSLSAYFENAISFQSLYGSLGFIPLFMFWVYLMWLVVLFGLEVSATIQMLQSRHLENFEQLEEKRPQNGIIDPASVLNLMEIVTERFAKGLPTTTREIADETLISENMVCQMTERLVKGGILHRVEGVDQALTLARPPEQIPGDKLLEIGFSLVDEAGVGRQSALLQKLREVQRSLAREATLATLLPPATTNKADDQAQPA